MQHYKRFVLPLFLIRNLMERGLQMTKNPNAIVHEDIVHMANQPFDWNKLENTTVLVTGASGFLATYIVELLLYLSAYEKKNITVLALVRDKAKAQRRFKHHGTRKDLVFLAQDVCTPLDAGSLGPVDYIIHAASQASPKFYGSDPVGTILPNVLGTQHLLTLAQEKASRALLFVSSGEVYGNLQSHQIPNTETEFGYLDPMDVRSCYGEAKRMGENLCVSSWRQYCIPVKIVRPFHTYGPGMDLNDGRVFADFVADIVSDRDIVMKSDGKNTRAFCYIADAVLGFFAVLLKGDDGEAYNIGSERETSILALAEMLVTIFPEKNLCVVRHDVCSPAGYVGTKISRTCPDISKSKQIGWMPRVDIREGFTRTIRSYLMP